MANNQLHFFDMDIIGNVGNQSLPSCFVNSSSHDKVAGSDVILLLWQICGPILLIIGLVGNVLVLVTMTRRPMRGTSTCVYLVGMAFIDLLVLIVGLLPGWLEGADIVNFKALNPIACKFQKFTDYSSGDAAVWLRMAFTIDRLVAVQFPLYTGNSCGRPASARMYVIVACVVAVAKDIHVFWTRGAQHELVSECAANGTIYENVTRLVSNCRYPSPDFKYFELYIRPWIAFTLVSITPFVIIAICNTLIIVAMVKRRRAMSDTMRQSLSTQRSLSKTSREQQFYQMAAMCVAASGLFLVCTAPTIVMLIGKPYWNVPKGQNAAYEISRAVTGILFYVTFSANFFLYCLTGKRFRTTLCGICRHGYHSTRSSTTVRDRQSKYSSIYERDNASTGRPRSNYQVSKRATNGISWSGAELTQIRSGSKEMLSVHGSYETALYSTPTDVASLADGHVLKSSSGKQAELPETGNRNGSMRRVSFDKLTDSDSERRIPSEQ